MLNNIMYNTKIYNIILVIIKSDSYINNINIPKTKQIMLKNKELKKLFFIFFNIVSGPESVIYINLYFLELKLFLAITVISVL